MSKKEYQWIIGEAPPPIGAHSFAKHRVYEEYLSHYLQVSYSNPRIPFANLSIVDAFSGGGEYTNPIDNSLYEGSPTRLLRTSESAEAAINAKRQSEGSRTEFNLKLTAYFIEKDLSAYNYLKKHLRESGYSDRIGNDIQLINDAFENKLDAITSDIKKRQRNGRSIFILDQYGWSQVPFSEIRAILCKLPKAEIILTFATEWMINYLSEDERFAKAYKKTGLDEVLPVESLLQDKSETRQWKGIIQSQLHKSIHALSGAKYYTPFFIKSCDSNRSFWLLHLSNHPRARDVMTSLHWRIKNQFSHHLGPGLRMFGYDPSKDESITGISDLFSDEYSFDEEAKQHTIDAVLEELPSIIYDYPDGITFSQFYILVANHTPATTAHLKEVIELLIGMNEIIVNSEDGKKRKKASTIKDGDILKVPRQLILNIGRYLIK